MIFFFVSMYVSVFAVIWLVTYVTIASFKNVGLLFLCRDFICSSDRGMTLWDATV